jgi:lipopolysaccharide/colanic/teichoic acid biosynthesis glycosyltransferase/SAM-dependent methyltransferase
MSNDELWDRMLKRSFDVLTASAGLAVLVLPMMALAAAVKIDSPGPVFHRGERVGRHGRRFRIVKFRSMRVTAATGPTSTSTNDDRITRVGRFIRQYKLDELSQLINVLRGEMSVVGPRPEVARFVALYTEEEKAILDVRPGITDWASIRFHNEGDIIAQSGYSDPDEAYMDLIRPEKVRLQLKYARERTFATDIRIVLGTLDALVRSRTADPRQTAPSARRVDKKQTDASAPGQRASGVRFATVTELAGDMASRAQLRRVCNRYYFAERHCGAGKDVLEVACGAGQGLGYLARRARRVVGLDIDAGILDIPKRTYRKRQNIEILRGDAQRLQLADASFDVVILYEALYYLPDPERFVSEAHRILRPGGTLLVCTANKDLQDFNPSPYSYRYFGPSELRALLEPKGFSVQMFGDSPVDRGSWKGTAWRLTKAAAVRLHLIPRTMRGKALLKRVVFGALVALPAEIDGDMSVFQPPVPIPSDRPSHDYAVIHCVAHRVS